MQWLGMQVLLGQKTNEALRLTVMALSAFAVRGQRVIAMIKHRQDVR